MCRRHSLQRRRSPCAARGTAQHEARALREAQRKGARTRRRRSNSVTRDRYLLQLQQRHHRQQGQWCKAVVGGRA